MPYAADMPINKISLPPLQIEENPRIREYNCYSDDQRATVVYHYLVTGLSFRALDVQILNLSENTNGWQSMGICHYLGLANPHKGFFKGWLTSDILYYFMQRINDPNHYLIFYYLEHYLEQTQSLTDIDRNMIYHENVIEQKEEIFAKDWISKTLLSNINVDYIDSTLLSLPSSVGEQGRKYVVDKSEFYIRNTTIKESVKSLYNYRCQICDDVILNKGWSKGLPRKQEWKYLSSDVHHILPLSLHGADDRSNMLCLCPTCHRKFHSGEFRLKQNHSGIYLSDELLGEKKPIALKHILHLD